MADRDDDPTRTAGGATELDTLIDAALDATLPSPTTPTPAAARSDELAPGASLGRYRIAGVLGRGGMGVVYHARDPDLERELAIKVVRAGAAGRRAQTRLLDEARVLARLEHPAVVPVFDVGTTEHGVHVVMPRITGGTLHDWLTAERRPWREVLARFVAAGRGLAAAHAAGLIHRDFKPKNVLVGEAGQVLVADFGIAATVGTGDRDHVASDPPPAVAQITSIAGTPAYMAPEQAQGDAIDARADQFSFCISLWEGLYGQRPHDAETRTGGSGGGLPPVPADRRDVPRWLRNAVARGFSATAADRWPSMNALLAHVDRRLHRPRRVAIAAGTIAVVAAAGVAIVATRPATADPCPDPQAKLSIAWSPAIRARVEASFAATHAPYAADMTARVVPMLDAYAGSWRTLHVETCRATHVAHTQSADLLDRRMVCLDRRLGELRARTDAFVRADAKVMEQSLEQASALPPIDDCRDDRALLVAQPLPADPVERAHISAIEHEVDDLVSFGIGGAPIEFHQRAQALVGETRAQAYLPSRVRALRALVNAEAANMIDKEATLRELAEVGARAKDDDALALAWSTLVFELTRLGRTVEAQQLEPVARAAVERADSPAQAVYTLETAIGVRESAAGHLDEAIAHTRASLAAASTPQQRRNSLMNLASDLGLQGKTVEARKVIEEAILLAERFEGPRHPSYALTLVVLGQILARSGEPADLARARDACARAAAIAKASLGDTSVEYGEDLTAGAHIAVQQGDYRDAEATFRLAVPIFEAVHDQPYLANALRGLADAVSAQRGLVEARPIYEHALLVARQGNEKILTASIEANLASELAGAGDCAAARPYAVDSKAVFDAEHIPAAAVLGMILARCDLDDGKVTEGFAGLEAALATCRAGGCYTGNLEDMAEYLGAQLVERHRDRARGLALVREARAGFAAIGRSDEVAVIDAWLAKHAR